MFNHQSNMNGLLLKQALLHRSFGGKEGNSAQFKEETFLDLSPRNELYA
jgi:hypothetical protein